MLKKTMTYIDFDNQERTEDFYFNLTQEEILRLEMNTTGGVKKMVDQIVAEKDMGRIISFFKQLVNLAYGRKSPDGKYFQKSPEISAQFESTQAYSDLFVELVTVPGAAEAFVNAIVPRVDPASKSPVAPLALT